MQHRQATGSRRGMVPLLSMSARCGMRQKIDRRSPEDSSRGELLMVKGDVCGRIRGTFGDWRSDSEISSCEAASTCVCRLRSSFYACPRWPT